MSGSYLDTMTRILGETVPHLRWYVLAARDPCPRLGVRVPDHTGRYISSRRSRIVACPILLRASASFLRSSPKSSKKRNPELIPCPRYERRSKPPVGDATLIRLPAEYRKVSAPFISPHLSQLSLPTERPLEHW